MNRRLLVFLLVFAIGCIAGFAYTYSITPVYVATANIQVEPGTTPDTVQDASTFVANEALVLTSNELLEKVLNTLQQKFVAFVGLTGVPKLREMLSAAATPGTNVIELRARGSEPEQLAAILGVWAATYVESRTVHRADDRDAAVKDARAAVDSLEQRVARKRRELEDFRRRNDIVSSERDENEASVQLKSLIAALNDARNKATDAESRLSAAKAGLAGGKPVYRPQDRTQIAQLEQRALELRQRLKDLELNFTPDYLAIDPNAKAMRANLQQVEKQIDDFRRTAQQESLNETAQELATAQKNVARLEEQVQAHRKDALSFTSRFSEQKAQSGELAQFESELAQARQRLALLERGERTREPRFRILGRPAVSQKPVRPDYPLYNAYTLGGSLAAALLAVLLVEFLAPRPKPEPPLAQPIIQIAYPALAHAGGADLPRLVGNSSTLPGPLQPPPALSSPLRELRVPEIQALWDAATSDARLAIASLFSGLTLPELAALRWDAVHPDSGGVEVREPLYRVHDLVPPLRGELEGRAPGRSPNEPIAMTAAGTVLSTADLEGLIAAAAHDAGLEQAEGINSSTLRHTYVSFLVREGVRLSELERLVGPLVPASFLHYRNLSPRSAGVTLSAADRVFPAFRTS